MASHPTTIEFVYFDLGNILVSFDPAIGCGNVAERYGVTTEAVHAAVYSSGSQIEWEHGAIDGEQFAERIRASLGMAKPKMPTAELLDAVSDMFTPIAGMERLVSRVRQSGRRVGVLSNTCHGHWDWILRQRYAMLTQPWDVTILSYEVGAMKPDPKIYEVAESACGAEPRQILFIDDRMENVEGARKRGWVAEQCFGGPAAIEIVERLLGLAPPDSA